MKPKEKNKTTGRNISRSTIKAVVPAKPRKFSAKKAAVREEIIRAPIRSGGSADAILFFDEADALFGKRTAVRNSHDRYSKTPLKSLTSNLRKRPSK